MSTDVMLIATQDWLHTTYGNNSLFTINVPTDGTGRADTIKGLIQALQIELGVEADGIWGKNTANAFDQLFPNGLSEATEVNTNTTIMHIIYILQGGFYTSRGIPPGGLDGAFGETLTAAVKTFQGQVGIEQNGIVKSYLLKVILTTDSYELEDEGDSQIRIIQQSLNNRYYEALGIIPTNGIYERETNAVLIKAIQTEIGVTVTGDWTEATMQALPILRRYGTVSNRQTVYILQYLLYLNGYDPNGFDGAFGGGVESAVKQCQEDYKLTADGSCGRQTWSALFVSRGDNTRSCTACDTACEITAERATILLNNGYKVVGRYLTNVEGGTVNKKLQDGEIQTILSSGLKFFPIFQENNREVEEFTFIKGTEQALKAIKAAKNYGIPHGTVIYFAVDCDLYESQILSNVVPYFKGIYQIFNADGIFRVGVYAARQACSILYEQGLVDYAFVAGASYKFAGNVAKKLPQNCCYDQFQTDVILTENFPIDRVEDKGVIEAVDHVITYVNTIDSNDRNANLYDIADKVYALAAEYNTMKNNASILKNNLLVLDFFRHAKYGGDLWTILARSIDEEWITYAKSHLDINVNEINIYIEELDKNVDLAHMVAAGFNAAYEYDVSDSYFRQLLPLDLRSIFYDYVGWAGDLIQLGAALEKRSREDESILARVNDQMIYNLVGCENSQYETELGIAAGTSGFPVEDLYQDVDGINIGIMLDSNTFGDALRIYYSGDWQKTRFKRFVENRAKAYYPEDVDDTDLGYAFIRSLANQYTKTNFYMEIFGMYQTVQQKYASEDGSDSKITQAIEKIKALSESVASLFGDFNNEIWGAVLAYGFAQKVWMKREDEVEE